MMFAYTRPADGGVSIVIAAPKADLERSIGSLTEDGYVEFVRNKSIPADALDIVMLPDDWKPPDSDRTFRNAWKQADGVFAVDMPAAREIWRNHIRILRLPMLNRLDVEYFQASERKDELDMQRIAADKQALRDAPADPIIEAAQTPDELRQAVPVVMKGVM